MAIPTIRSVGTVGQGASAIAPGRPVGSVQNDLWIMFIATAGGEAITAATWTEHPSSPIDNGTTRLTVLYRLVSASPGTDPTTTSDSGDHQIGRIVGITVGTFDATWIHTAASNTQTSTTAVSISGPTTTLNDCLILAASAGNLPDAVSTAEFSGEANAALSTVVEQVDNTHTGGAGGALLVISGGLATAGAVGATTATAVTAATRANLAIAIASLPPAAGQTLTGTLFAKAPTFPLGVLSSRYTVAGTLFTKAPTFPTGVLTQSAPPAGSTVTVAGSTVTVTTGGTVTITGPGGVVYSGGSAVITLPAGFYTWTSTDGSSGSFTVSAGGNRMGGSGAVRKPPRHVGR